MKKRLCYLDVDLSLFTKNNLEWKKTKTNCIKEKIPLDFILVKNSNYNRVNLKKRLLKEGLLENKCVLCGQLPEWNGKPLTLQLDHINGVYNDNRIENLRVLCGHCHSQTDTFSGRNSKREKSKLVYFKPTKRNSPKKKKVQCYCSCGEQKDTRSIKCVKCSNKSRTGLNRKFEVTKEQLQDLIANNPMTKIGKMFGVSDNAIRKRMKFLERLGTGEPKSL